ncbi:uncharacterized protein [Epargyreus clarus]|uniref:uncharacterized protein n=1 Tax=Epargyreus clarus TaxID=520877 RepID=UPI003C2ADBAE
MAEDFRLCSYIQMIENNRVLYDTEHPDYKNEQLKMVIWHAIAHQFNLNVIYCRWLWQCLYTAYFTALSIVDETNYVSKDMILNRFHLKFLDAHQKNFVHRPVNVQLIEVIVGEIKIEVEREKMAKYFVFSEQIIEAVRQVKLSKWCETTCRKTDPKMVSSIRKKTNKIMIDLIKDMRPDLFRKPN